LHVLPVLLHKKDLDLALPIARQAVAADPLNEPATLALSKRQTSPTFH